jgi:transcriptional regulator with XRE-family HTH domain
MATKAQHTPEYERLRSYLRTLRDGADLTQRELGGRLGKPQSWVHNCETGNRRVDVTEFIAWAGACDVDAQDAFRRFMESGLPDEGPEDVPGASGGRAT